MADRGFNVILVIADVLTHIIMIQDTAAPAPVTRRVAVVADTVRVCRTFFRPRNCDTVGKRGAGHSSGGSGGGHSGGGHSSGGSSSGKI